MNWIKLGKIFEVNNYNDWLVSHSAVPFVKYLKDDVFRIYFSVRRTHYQSQSSFFDFHLTRMKVVNQLTTEPLLVAGIKGDIDDAGVVLSCFCKDNEMYYYMAYNAPKNVPYNNQVGAAYYKDDLLIKYSKNPILRKCDKEPHSFGCPWVLKVKDNYFMWYDTNLDWNMDNPWNYKFRDYFLKKGTDLDKEAYQRGTSVYLVDRVVQPEGLVLFLKMVSLKCGIQ